uniref:Uncharacterized protein n=1 Tax=Arundo donax TaxID=35708 RepID=A0A0A8YB69_ARUDO
MIPDGNMRLAEGRGQQGVEEVKEEGAEHEVQ